MNNIIEDVYEIIYCPYCGSNDIVKDKGSDTVTCDDCGHDFTVMTHE